MTTNLQGSLMGAILLIAGCCIGAGMLGLPLVTGVAGFAPSTVMFILSWLFMAITGLLLLEVNLWFIEEDNLITLAGRTLGSWGKFFAWGLFTFLFYSLMVAYVSASGSLVSAFVMQLGGMIISPGLSSLALVLFFLLFLYFGTGAVDHINRLLMAALGASYLLLVKLGIGHMQTERLLYTDWKEAFFVVPTMVISFGYHNLIPSLKTYLGGDLKRLRIAILVGSGIPLIVYLIWDAVILGLLPLQGGFKAAIESGLMATELLRTAVGREWVVDVAESFAFFAVVTSFLSVALSFVDFLADGLGIVKKKGGKLFLCLLAVGPPYVFSLFYPKIFLIALSLAGAFGAVMLFGVMPAMMVWEGRYRQRYSGEQLVPGGKATLISIMVFSFAVLILECFYRWGA